MLFAKVLVVVGVDIYVDNSIASDFIAAKEKEMHFDTTK
jgi:hypothetical protein